MRELERQVLLQVIDRKWREHLYEMDYLKEGIGLRAMAQRDPLVEYQREGFDMFAAMLDGIKEETVGLLFNVQVQAATAPRARRPRLEADGPAAAPAESRGRSPAAPADPPIERTARQPRLAPCQRAGRHAAPETDPDATGVLPPC